MRTYEFQRKVPIKRMKKAKKTEEELQEERLLAKKPRYEDDDDDAPKDEAKDKPVEDEWEDVPDYEVW